MADKTVTVTVAAVVNGKQVGEILASPKHFGTGSDGYFASDKVLINGAKYQVTCNIVRVHSGKENAAKAASKA
jgi:hypothetical protein